MVLYALVVHTIYHYSTSQDRVQLSWCTLLSLDVHTPAPFKVNAAVLCFLRCEECLFRHTVPRASAEVGHLVDRVILSLVTKARGAWIEFSLALAEMQTRVRNQRIIDSVVFRWKGHG